MSTELIDLKLLKDALLEGKHQLAVILLSKITWYQLHDLTKMMLIDKYKIVRMDPSSFSYYSLEFNLPDAYKLTFSLEFDECIDAENSFIVATLAVETTGRFMYYNKKLHTQFWFKNPHLALNFNTKKHWRLFNTKGKREKLFTVLKTI